MRRKIIKQGHNTLTLTLPSRWATEHNLKAGHEIEIIEARGSLTVYPQRREDICSTTIDIRGLNIPTIWKYYMAAVREGYDEIVFTFDPQARFANPYRYYKERSLELETGKSARPYSPHELVLLMTSRFVGLEVVESYNDRCVVKDISETNAKEFQTSLRRVFLLIKQMAHEMQEAIKTGNPSLVTHAHEADITVDKFNDFCLRVLNKNGQEIKKPHLMFATLYLLEMIGDEFKHICYNILENMKGRRLSVLYAMEKMITDQFDMAYDLFYNYDAKKVVTLSENDFQIQKYSPKGKAQMTPTEIEIFNYFRRIGHYINALVELRVEMEF